MSMKTNLSSWLSGEVDIWTKMGSMQDERGGNQTEATHIQPALADRELRLFRRFYPVAAVILCLVFSFVLILTVSNLPRYGMAEAPVNNEVAARYLSQGVQDTGAVNAVAGMISNYRGFDTLGEAHVLFTGVAAVMILLEEALTERQRRRERREEALCDLSKDSITHGIVRILVPCILIFGLYVILNGHLSPGGGFSGGSILGAGLILHALGFGFENTERLVNERVYGAVKVTALLLYALMMLYFIFMGANALNAHIPLGTPGAILSAGLILPINIVVGMEVACTMYGLYSLFQRGRI